jgi:hypothetical protein
MWSESKALRHSVGSARQCALFAHGFGVRLRGLEQSVNMRSTIRYILWSWKARLLWGRLVRKVDIVNDFNHRDDPRRRQCGLRIGVAEQAVYIVKTSNQFAEGLRAESGHSMLL